MASPPAHSLLITTTASVEEAEQLAAGLVESRLAACVQIGRVVSHYLWDGARRRAAESLLLVKTTAGRAGAATAYIAEHHSYETPEVVEIPITAGLPAYLGWITESVSPRASGDEVGRGEDDEVGRGEDEVGRGEED